MFDEGLREAANTDYWSEINPTGQRIHWKSLNVASNHPSKKAHLDASGCYLFGWGSVYENVIPRYVGETGRSLKERLREKYIRGPRANPKPWQERTCNLAEEHEGRLTGPMGWKAFPDDFLLEHFGEYKHEQISKAFSAAISCKSDDERYETVVGYLRQCANATMQLRGSEDFARRGIDQIWFALIPTSCKKEDRLGLEDVLTKVMNQWNRRNGHAKLLNR